MPLVDRNWFSGGTFFLPHFSSQCQPTCLTVKEAVPRISSGHNCQVQKVGETLGQILPA